MSIGNDSSRTIEVRILHWGDGVLKVDVRRYVETGRYSGATQKGISLMRHEFAALVQAGTVILRAFEELDPAERYPAPTEPAPPVPN